MHRIQNYNRLYNLSRPFSFSVVSLVTSGPNTCHAEAPTRIFDTRGLEGFIGGSHSRRTTIQSSREGADKPRTRWQRWQKNLRIVASGKLKKRTSILYTVDTGLDARLTLLIIEFVFVCIICLSISFSLFFLCFDHFEASTVLGPLPSMRFDKSRHFASASTRTAAAAAVAACGLCSFPL